MSPAPEEIVPSDDDGSPAEGLKVDPAELPPVAIWVRVSSFYKAVVVVEVGGRSVQVQILKSAPAQ